MVLMLFSSSWFSFIKYKICALLLYVNLINKSLAHCLVTTIHNRCSQTKNTLAEIFPYLWILKVLGDDATVDFEFSWESVDLFIHYFPGSYWLKARWKENPLQHFTWLRCTFCTSENETSCIGHDSRKQ